MNDLSGKRVLVLGLGISGRSAASFCASQGAEVVAVDERSGSQLEGLGELPPRVTLRLGEPFPDAANFDLVVPSPGVPRERYRACARRAWGDVELAFRALAVPVVAVTGTNGKSTTVCLIEAMLRAAGLRALAAGNLGEPALGLVGRPIDVAVLEVSSFQLETTDAFRPRVSALLNLSEDHLDRHGSLEEYTSAKRRIFARQEAEDIAVLNGDDPRVTALRTGIRAEIHTFRRCTPSERGAWWDGAAMVLRLGGEDIRLPLEGVQLGRGHHRENALAALLAASAAGADPSKAVRALASFTGLPHRGEPVGRIGGVEWINDSKATNPGAARAAITSQTAPVVWIAGGRDKGLAFEALAEAARGQTAPVVWIAGGRDKGLAFEALAEAARGRVRAALLIGEAAGKIAQALTDHVACQRVGTLEEAVHRAHSLAEPGDVVVLAPACASFDQFADFEDRGDQFRQLVNALPEAGER
jgi:UDP-N-acetylmuramoylalanine--D-glutamate ligase